MKKIKLVALTMFFTLGLFAGCSKEGNPDKANDETKISLMSSLEKKNDKVWLVIETEKLSKDSIVSYAIKGKSDGEVYVSEHINTSLTDLNDTATKNIWKLLLDKANNNYPEMKQKELDELKTDSQISEDMLSRLEPNNPNATTDGLDRGILEQMLKENQERTSDLNAIVKYEVAVLPIKAKVKSDDTGNNVVKEIVEIGEEKKVKGYEDTEYLSPLSKYFGFSLTRVLTGDNHILDHNYVGYAGKGVYVITRAENNESEVFFDTAQVKGVVDIN